MEKQKPIQPRKNILSLSPEQRKRYFWCLKMLAILPAPETSSDWYFNSLAPEGVNKIQPQCIHDVMIASHATCCEHFSFYFGPYHRHLIITMEMWLNFANQVLLGGKNKLKSFAPTLYEQQDQLWDIIFLDYQKFTQGLTPKVMAHYWNPTNYRDERQLSIPIEISDPNETPHDLDIVDELFYSIRKHYPWDINVKQRWFNPSNSFQTFRKNFVKKMLEGTQFNYFHQPFEYFPEEMLMVKGKITPRTNISTFFKTYLNYLTYNRISGVPTSDMNPSCLKKTASRNMEYFNKTQTNMHLAAIRPEEIQVNFGSLKKNMYHLNLQEIGKMSTADRISAVNYNEMLPYYQLAYALFNETYFSKLTEFMSPKQDSGNGFQRSHNTMHNNFFFSMMDANLSINNLMFYPFHSWVDLTFEFRARADQDQALQLKRYLSQVKQYNNYFDYIMFRNSPPIRGQYPVMSWANPLIRDIVDQVNAEYTPNPAPLQILFQATASFSEKDIVSNFNSSDFLLDGKCIRTSKRMNSLYHKEITNVYKEEYNFFEGLKRYDFNYDYELYETLADGSIKTSLLSEDGSNIPDYLQELKPQVNHYPNQIKLNVKRSLASLKQPKDERYYHKLVMSTISVLGKYKSTIANGAHPITAEFKQIVELAASEFNEDQKKIMSSGFIIHIFEILGKAAQANKCLNCGQFKQFRFEMGQKVFLRFPKLWKAIHKLIVSQTALIFSSDSSEICNTAEICSKLSLIKRPYFDNFKMIVGSQQVCIDTIYKGSEEGSIRIDLESRSVQDEVIRTIVSKQSYRLNYTFDFYKLHDVDRGKRQKYFEHFTYTRVIGLVTIGKRSFEFTFEIPNFHSFIRYTAIIEQVKEGEELTVRILDADYDFKRQFYSNFEIL